MRPIAAEGKRPFKHTKSLDEIIFCVARTIAATQFQPTDARRAFPCFDEPAMKATFNITMVHDPAFIALTNMPKIQSSTRGGLTVDKFERTLVMPTYLLAFIVCDFGSVKTVSSNNVNVSTCYMRTSFLMILVMQGQACSGSQAISSLQDSPKRPDDLQNLAKIKSCFYI